MKGLFDSSETVFEQQLKEIFKPNKKEGAELFDILSLVISFDKSLEDSKKIYKTLGLESFTKLVTLLDGKTFKCPTLQELKDAVILSLCFYYKEIEGKDWDEIHELVPYEFSSISVSYKIKSFSLSLRNELVTIFTEGGK